MEKYLLKCDISGIQKFIFNVPSKGAAMALKSRSVFVQKIAEETMQALQNYFGNGNSEVLYDGGGNFYLNIKTDKSEQEIMCFIDDNVYKPNISKDIFAYVSFVKNTGEDTGTLLDAVNQKVNRAKMQRPISFDLLDARPIQIEEVDINTIKGINGQVPNGDFSDIAKLSEGDSKLAALKLDVDNLGTLFCNRTENDYKCLSQKLKDFFDGQLLQLIKDLQMQQYIYVVFSGGDDCFLIGAWDKIFELAFVLQKKFADFQSNLKAEIKSLPQDKEITFSAGIIVFQSHYPMLQLAEKAEDALSTSKQAECKNSITVFGKILSWRDFEETKKLSITLSNLINNADERNKESKSLLQIFRLIEPQKKETPKVWQLKYYLRRHVKEENKKTVGEIFDKYSQALLQKYVGSKAKNSDIYLVASRWAELLSRN